MFRRVLLCSLTRQSTVLSKWTVGMAETIISSPIRLYILVTSVKMRDAMQYRWSQLWAVKELGKALISIIGMGDPSTIHHQFLKAAVRGFHSFLAETMPPLHFHCCSQACEDQGLITA